MKVPWVDEPPTPDEANEDSLVEMTEEDLKRLRKFQKSNGRFPTRDEIVALLRRLRKSKKFQEWTPQDSNLPLHRQQHHPPTWWASQWNVSADTIRLLFENEDGVIIIGDHKGTKRKRRYRTMLIPETVAARVHRRLSKR